MKATSTTMLLLLITFLALAAQQGGATISCYVCSTNPDHPKYDVTCGNPEYTNNVESCDWCNSCFVHVYDNGLVHRDLQHGSLTQECHYGESYTACYCYDDLCNKGLCEQCEQ
ncbi:unnamed protein product [Meganyctiphanes norvegica]|uniref:Uncharacterized protein n=1 Tax=Meganyctiphanes norvegica TaxID=48144 RepID=A0AAV2PRR1_MEGNR